MFKIVDNQNGLVLRFPPTAEGKVDALLTLKCLLENSHFTTEAVQALIDEVEAQDWHLTQ